ncbi:MAG: peptidase M48 Ste24p [Phycisphaeraceae bacterium]|nr:peptidase M48 Ste24p [Phycisphaeraceae bacterium]
MTGELLNALPPREPASLPRKPVRAAPTALLIATLALAGGCAVNKDTGESQWIVLNEQREIALGTEAAPKFVTDYGGPIPAEDINQYVRHIGQQLSRTSGRPQLPWEFHVVDSSVINAFALPGGKVFVSRGLLEKMDNEAQLAGVLGHEIGHVTAKHANDAMARQIGFQAVLTGIGIATQHNEGAWLKVLGVGVEQGGTVFLLRYSRAQEYESDLLGTRYMAAGGYNPRALLEVLEILKEAGGHQEGSLQLLSTHPLPASRIKKLRQHIEQTYPSSPGGVDDGYFRQRFADTVIRNLAALPPARHGRKATGKSDDG